MTQTEKVGHINYSNKNNTSENPCRIHHLFVEDAYRKMGVGSQLLKIALSEQFNSGCEKVTLDVYNDTFRFFSKKIEMF